jgi:putative chitinase
MGFKFYFTSAKLQKLVPKAKGGVEGWYDGLCDALPQYEIDTVNRVAAFVAQCAHESGGFSKLEEGLSYSAKGLTGTWPKRFPANIAAQYERKPEKIANRAYCDRMGNGSEASGDGWKYRGRGLLQLTGKDNYKACSQFLFQDDTLVKDPDLLLDPYYATHSACWFWWKNKLNPYADAGNILTLTKKINGGTIGLDDRIKHYKHAIEVLSGSH